MQHDSTECDESLRDAPWRYLFMPCHFLSSLYLSYLLIITFLVSLSCFESLFSPSLSLEQIKHSPQATGDVRVS